MIIVYNYRDKKPFTIIGKKRNSGGSKIPIPEIENNEHIIAIQNIDNVEGTVLMRQPFSDLDYFNNCKISTNGNTFDDYVFGTPINIQPKDIVYFKYNKNSIITNREGNNSAINSTVKYKVAGILRSSSRYVYNSFFLNETNLIDASELQLSNNLSNGCYYQMFSGCTSLTTAPELPATTLETYCYNSMFSGCTSLTSAPELPATTLETDCYYQMFRGCTALNYVKTNIINWDINYTQDWLKNVAPTGTVECPANSTIPRGSTSGIPIGWIRVDENGNVIPIVDEDKDILVIENVDTVEGTVFMYNPNSIPIEYSTDGEIFNDYPTATEIPFGVGEKVYFKWIGVISNFYNSTALVNSSVKYKIYGELKKGKESNAYHNMFYNQSNLIDASQLKLTAIELGNKCYHSMFRGCTALTTAPELPATTLETDCYYIMFYGCTSLNYVKHNIISWNTNDTKNWLSGVASTGTVECPANSTIPSDSISGIPSGWTRVDIE